MPRAHRRHIWLDELVQIVADAGLVHQRVLYTRSLKTLLVRGGDPLAELSTAYDLASRKG